VSPAGADGMGICAVTHAPAKHGTMNDV
jgi:hypothetical protein